MKSLKFLFVVITFYVSVIVEAAPLDKYIETDPELTAGYFEGDMILGPTRNGVPNEHSRWPNNTVYYRFCENHFDAQQMKHVLLAMRKIESVSCIRFKQAVFGQENYVNMTSMPGGCYSAVGFLGKVQNFNLQQHAVEKGCFRLSLIIHELLHTIGFYHMHSSANRDDYIRIVEENIQDGMQYHFRKLKDHFVDAYDQEYDFNSILHYKPKAFSKNGQPTIVALNDTAEAKNMGQQGAMSKSDINRLNIMYRCPLKV